MGHAERRRRRRRRAPRIPRTDRAKPPLCQIAVSCPSVGDRPADHPSSLSQSTSSPPSKRIFLRPYPPRRKTSTAIFPTCCSFIFPSYPSFSSSRKYEISPPPRRSSIREVEKKGESKSKQRRGGIYDWKENGREE